MFCLFHLVSFSHPIDFLIIVSLTGYSKALLWEKQNTYFRLWRENLNSKKVNGPICEVDDKFTKVNDIMEKLTIY